MNSPQEHETYCKLAMYGNLPYTCYCSQQSGSMNMTTVKHVNDKVARLEARITADQKNLFQHAATLLGRSLTDFVISALQEAAKRTIQEHEIIQLSLRDQQLFAQAILNPAEPNAKLLKAAKRHS